MRAAVLWWVVVSCAAIALAAGVPPLAAAAPGRYSKALLVVTSENSRIYHLSTCPQVKEITRPTVLTVEQAERQGKRPHDCDAATRQHDEAAALVWVDMKTRRYHLAGCSLVGVPRAQLPLSQAAAKYRPCNACKPPQPATK